MTDSDFAAVASSEVCERAARILVSTTDLCAETGCPLTPEQQIILGSAVFQAFLGIEDCLSRMCGAREAIERVSDVFSDERLAAWVDGEIH